MVGKGHWLFHMDTEAWLRTEETTVPIEGDTSEATEQTIRT
jgi:hypothetical protein